MDLVDKAHDLLRQARTITHGWLRDFMQKLQNCDEIHFKKYQEILCEIAATCRSSYDTDRRYVAEQLRDDQDVAIYLECAIVLHDNQHSSKKKTDAKFQRIMDRDRRLAHMMEPFVRQKVQQRRGGIDQAIHALWGAYRQGSDWEALNAPNERWMSCYTGRGHQSEQPQEVHFNLLTGELLVNAKPLGRLPRQIVEHPMYQRIFGNVSATFDNNCESRD
jgi:hypothetical protein